MNANKALGILIMGVLALTGGLLIYTGVSHGILRQRLPRLKPGTYYEGRAAVSEGVVRALVGLGILGFLAYLILS
jgi:hypothetical protein